MVGETVLARFDHAFVNDDPGIPTRRPSDDREPRARRVGPPGREARGRPAREPPPLGGPDPLRGLPGRGLSRAVATMELTKIMRFSAAHRLASPALSRPRTAGSTGRARASRPQLRARGDRAGSGRRGRDGDGPDRSRAGDARRSSISWTTGISAATSRARRDGHDRREPRRDVLPDDRPGAAPGRLVRVAVVETENNRFEYEATGEAP